MIESKNEKPEVKLSDEDGNVFSIIGRVSKALKRAGYTKESQEFCDSAFNAQSYDEVLQLCFKYVEVT